MAQQRSSTESLADARAYQDAVLPKVSRTFALTIPQLPRPLDEAVSNAYLLCRIADTIEDDPGLGPADKNALHDGFVAALRGEAEPADFAGRAEAACSGRVPEAERDLLRETPRVLTVTRSLSAAHQEVLTRCVAIMCEGMGQYQRNASLRGLGDVDDVDRYCYYVAGVVGEMLTELFCLHSPAVAARRSELLELAPSFGEGLQLTNILKDVWDDRARGACWLPRGLFARHGVELGVIEPGQGGAGFARAMHTMVGVAHGHLCNAFAYTRLIPPDQTGIRRFCLWALGLAVLTLRRIRANPGFSAGREVKVSRRAVKATIVASSATVRRDALLRLLFRGATAGLPYEPAVDTRRRVSVWDEGPGGRRTAGAAAGPRPRTAAAGQARLRS